MEDHALQVLELGHVLERLAAHARLPRTKLRAREPQFPDRAACEACFDATEAVLVLAAGAGWPPLVDLSPVGPLLDEIAPANSLLSAAETRACGRWLAFAEELRSFFRAAGEASPLPAALAAVTAPIAGQPRVASAIARAINEQDEVVDDASPRLKEIRRGLRDLAERVNGALRHVLFHPDHADWFQERIVTLREGRYVVPLKANFKERLRGIIHDRSASGETLFLEPEAVVELNNELKTLAIDEQLEIARILKELADLLREAAPGMRAAEAAIEELDLVTARARLARSLRLVRPAFGERLDLVEARHPLLTHEPVPVDLRIGGGDTALVVTGPNTGGKTVTLKTAGLLALMARAGLFIPAAPGSSLPFYDAVYCDVGDEQSIEQSLSTFSSHMTNIIRLLDRADARSLVLLDELGAGTDPQEGAALGIAILEELVRRKAHVVVTTHYGAIKQYAYLAPGITTASVAFDVATLRPTYRLLYGAPGSSKAFEIVARLGLPPELVAAARQRLDGEAVATEELLSRIERDMAGARESKRLAEAKERLRGDLAEEYEKKLSRLERDRARLVAEAREEAREIRRRAEETAAALLADLRARAAAPSAREEAELKHRWRAEFDGIEEDAAETPPAPPPEPAWEPAPGSPLAAGELVEILKLRKTGPVLKVDGERVLVSVGSFQTWVGPAEYRRTGRRPAAEATGPRMAPGAAVYPVLDLRGMLYEEAADAVRRYVEDAHVAGLLSVTIVHGKGTGALREATGKVLGDHPFVESFAFAHQERGGYGATDVKLKG